MRITVTNVFIRTAFDATRNMLDSHTPVVRGMMWLPGRVAAMTIALAIMMYARRNMRTTAQEPETDIDLQELRRLRDLGRRSAKEYETLVQK